MFDVNTVTILLLVFFFFSLSLLLLFVFTPRYDAVDVAGSCFLCVYAVCYVPVWSSDQKACKGSFGNTHQLFKMRRTHLASGAGTGIVNVNIHTATSPAFLFILVLFFHFQWFGLVTFAGWQVKWLNWMRQQVNELHRKVVWLWCKRKNRNERARLTNAIHSEYTRSHSCTKQ